MNNDISFITIVRYHIPYDICRFLIESIELYWQYRYLFYCFSDYENTITEKGVRE